MTQPDSAMAAAREIWPDPVPFNAMVVGEYPVQLFSGFIPSPEQRREEIAAIIRKHQAQEIGELVEALRGLISTEWIMSRSWGEPHDWIERDEVVAKAESLLSRYPKGQI